VGGENREEVAAGVLIIKTLGFQNFLMVSTTNLWNVKKRKGESGISSAKVEKLAMKTSLGLMARNLGSIRSPIKIVL